MSLNIKIGMIAPLDMIKFAKMPKVREERIAATPAKPLPKTYASNAKAEIYHPRRQNVVIDAINDNVPGVKEIVLKAKDGRLAPFRAGQYISIGIRIGDVKTCRSYSISSAPELAKEGIYKIAVKEDPSGFVSPYIHKEWKVGQELTISSPEGFLYYEPLRDCRKVLALAGGIGITPFMAMAHAVASGREDCDLTVIFGARTADAIPYKNELDELAAACDKVHVVYVLSDEEKEGYEHGFISAELIKKYGGDDYSVFMCGPQAMYKFLECETAKLGLDQKHVRRELFGTIKAPWECPGYPTDSRGKTYKCTVKQCGEVYELEASADESLLAAIERAGIAAPSRCRSGECGWCRSKLKSGTVYIPEVTDGRRFSDIQYGYIHPCASFPTSDVVIDVPAEYLF